MRLGGQGRLVLGVRVCWTWVEIGGLVEKEEQAEQEEYMVVGEKLREMKMEQSMGSVWLLWLLWFEAIGCETGKGLKDEVCLRRLVCFSNLSGLLNVVSS